MARYIDADKFIERLKASPAFPNMGMDGYFLLDVVENLLKKFPAADVAPKSEVAREIFEEIFNIIRAYEFDALTAKNVYGVFQVRNLGTDILKLKKKYTEEKE